VRYDYIRNADEAKSKRVQRRNNPSLNLAFFRATIVWAIPIPVATKRTACTVLEDSTTPRSTRIVSKSRQKVQSLSLTGLLLIMSRLEILAIKKWS
jgi:hypothetical protein